MNLVTDMSIDEEKAVEELRKRMKEEMEPDMYEDVNIFYRFLKARDFNMKNAEQMLRKHLEWRKNMDMKMAVIPEVIEKHYPYNFLGYDKEGSVVRYYPLGTVDIKGFLNSLRMEEMEKCLVYMAEDDAVKLKQKSEELKKPVSKCLCITNLEHLSIRNLTSKKAFQSCIIVANSFERNYPETLKACYMINGSVQMAMLYNIVKMLVKPEILGKIHIYSDDSWKDDLLKEVDADVLPAFLAGTRTDPDGNPLCLTFVNHGGKLPEKYYIQQNKRPLTDLDGMKQISLPTGSLHKEMHYIEEPGSCIIWEFQTQCRDIGFGLYYVDVCDVEEKMIELLPLQRTETKNYSESGRHICRKAGKYVFLFDNSYSWLRAKEVYYRIKITKPEEKKTQPISR